MDKKVIFISLILVFSASVSAQDDSILSDGPSAGNLVDGVADGAASVVGFAFNAIIPVEGEWSSLSQSQKIGYSSVLFLLWFGFYLTLYFGADELDLINTADPLLSKRMLVLGSFLLTGVFLGTGKFAGLTWALGTLMMAAIGFVLIAATMLIGFGGIGAVYGAIGWGARGADRGYQAYQHDAAQRTIGRFGDILGGGAGSVGVNSIHQWVENNQCNTCDNFSPRDVGEPCPFTDPPHGPHNKT